MGTNHSGASGTRWAIPAPYNPSDNEPAELHWIPTLHSPTSPPAPAVTQTARLHFHDVLTIIFTCHLISDFFFLSLDRNTSSALQRMHRVFCGLICISVKIFCGEFCTIQEERLAICCVKSLTNEFNFQGPHHGSALTQPERLPLPRPLSEGKNTYFLIVLISLYL